jgi:hypothetical protein
MQNNDTNSRRFVILGLVIFLLIFVAIWIYGHSYIEVVVDNPSQGDVTYELLNQNSAKSSSKNQKETSYKVMIPKGDYDLVVTQAGQSAFAAAHSGGFLKKTTLHLSLSPEKSRQFVGDNPSSCLYYDSVLYSYDCGGSINSLAEHVPATPILPTFADKKFKSNRASFEAVIKTPSGVYSLMHLIGESEESSHVAYTIGNNFEVAKTTILHELDTEKSYSFYPYENGFIAYDSDFNVRYFSSAVAPAAKIALDKPNTKNLQPQLLNVSGGSIVANYSNATSGEQSQASAGKAKNEIVIYSDGKNIHVNMDKHLISDVNLCGNQNLCFTSDNKLWVYDISGQKPKLILKIADVKAFRSAPQGLLAVRSQGVFNINPTSGAGYMEYSFGDYKYCGIQNDDTGYTLCLINSKNRKVALHINQSGGNTDSIDKKIAALIKKPEVLNVSAYGKYVFISPSVGDLVYIPAKGGYGYDPNSVKTAADKINQEIADLNIDRAAYTIINTSL